jgi:hypothetical protein
MLRRFWATVAVLALLCGFSAAPFTHAHHAIDAVSDEHHPHGDTLVHTHASPHARGGGHDSVPAPPGHHDSGDRIWSVDTFVCQLPAASHPPSPALLVFGEANVPSASSWLGAERLQPKANSPPAGSPPGLRAPPAILPVLA